MEKRKGAVVDALHTPKFAFPKESGETWASWKREDAAAQFSSSDPCTGAEMDWLEAGGSTLSPKSLGVSWFFLPACEWLSQHRSAMAGDEYFLGRLQPLENSTINPSPLGSVKPSRTSPGPAGVRGGFVAPKLTPKLGDKSKMCQVHFQTFFPLEFRFIFPQGFLYPHKQLLNAWDVPDSPSPFQEGQGHQLCIWINPGKKMIVPNPWQWPEPSSSCLIKGFGCRLSTSRGICCSIPSKNPIDSTKKFQSPGKCRIY